MDFIKTGVKVDFKKDILGNEKFRVTAKPDFLRLGAFYDSRGEFYKPEDLLGKIYRANKNLVVPRPETIDNSGLQNNLSKVWASDAAFVSEFKQLTEDEGYKELKSCLKSEMFHYRKYLDTQQLTKDSEIDIFLRQPSDDYP